MKIQIKMCILTILLAFFIGGCGSGGSGNGGGEISSEKAITAYSIDGAAGTINEPAKSIAVTMPNGTNVTALVATFTTTGTNVKVGAADQVSGTTANDFTNPVSYTVIAADGTTADYTVTVTVAASSKAITAGIDGGAFALSDNKVKFDFVPRAVLSDTEINITPLNSFPSDPRVIPGTVYEFAPDGILFNGRVEVTITYDPNNLPTGVNEKDIVISKLVNGSWQPVFGSMADTEANTVSVPIRGFSTYALMDGKRVNSLTAYVVSSPSADNQFSDIGSAAAYICQNLQSGQRGAVIIQKSPVSIGTLNIACDVEIRADDNTTTTIDGASTISSSAPVSFVGFTFGSATFNTGDDLTLISNTFQDLNVNPGTGGASAPAAKLQKSPSLAPAVGCFDGNTLIKGDTVAGTLTLGGGAKVCGDIHLQNGGVTSLVAAGDLELAAQAKFELNGTFIKSITAELDLSGEAEMTVASIKGLDVSTFKLHGLDGDIKLNQLKHDISGSVKVETDGIADLTLNQKELKVSGNHTINTSGMGVETKTYYNATLNVDGAFTLNGGGTMEGKLKDTTVKGSATVTLGANAKEAAFDQNAVTFKGEVRHNLLPDLASQQVTLIIQGNASSTYEKGLGTCISTGASARVEYTNSIIKQAGFESLGAGLLMVGKTSCDGQLQKTARMAGKSTKTLSLAPDAGNTDEIIIRNIVFPDQVLQSGIVIKDVDIPVTIDNNQIKAQLLGIRIQNVSKKVLINNNTIDAIGGVVLADLPDAIFSNNRQNDPVGLVVNMEPGSGTVISRIVATNNTLSTGAIVGGSFGTSVITATGNTLFTAYIWPNSYGGFQGNTFTNDFGEGYIEGSSSIAGNGLIIDPGKGNNSGLDDENSIGTDIDWTGNGCGDYPPSDDRRDPEGNCYHDGIPVPTAP